MKQKRELEYWEKQDRADFWGGFTYIAIVATLAYFLPTIPVLMCAFAFGCIDW